MRRPAQVPFVVHVAGAAVKSPASPAAGETLVQRCVACGFVLIDNTAWLAGTVAVAPLNLAAAGGATVEARPVDGPSWYPIGALIGTSKTDENQGGMTYVRPEGRPLGADERSCG